MMSGETTQPITEVSMSPLRPGLADELRPVLEAHGASIQEKADRCCVSFPTGTTSQRRWPVTLTTHYDIRLPDGYVLLYVVAHNGKTNLCFDLRDLPPGIEERYPEGEKHGNGARGTRGAFRRPQGAY